MKHFLQTKNVHMLLIWETTIECLVISVDDNYDSYFSKGDAEKNTLTEFNSNNTQLLSVEETKDTISKLAYIQERLAEV